jgi:hypothetical protein
MFLTVADLIMLLMCSSSVAVGGGLGDQIVRSRFSFLYDGLQGVMVLEIEKLRLRSPRRSRE